MLVDPERVVFDISSDEEIVSDEYDWITELLGEGDERNKDDFDDVVVVGEVIMNPKQNSKSLTKTDDDDDCVVLEEDPDKPVKVVNDRGGDDDDDLLVVSEKGQIACRDYPHPRHLCAKFPFGSTPHEKHCDQCYCYVCDTLAPCVYWDTGISSVAHCHATDKDEFWKAQRQSTRKSDKALPLVTPGRDTSVSVPPPVTTTENWLCTHCGQTGHYKSTCKARFQSSQKNKNFVEKEHRVEGSSQKKKNVLPGWTRRSLIHPFYNYKGHKLVWVSKSNH